MTECPVPMHLSNKVCQEIIQWLETNCAGGGYTWTHVDRVIIEDNELAVMFKLTFQLT